MADTTVNSANRVQQWADDFFYEFVREFVFKSLMGTDSSSAIQVKEQLTKQAGDRITFSLVSRLSGAGVTGDNTLEGNEEALGNYGHQVTVDQLRNGVVVGKYESIKTKIDLLNAAKAQLKMWAMEQLRDMIIARLLSPVTDGKTTYAAATETQKDAWCAANNPSTANQRILFGAAKSNSSGDHSADLAKIDSTNDDLHQDIVGLMKRMAQSADPHIRPLMTKGQNAGKERFVLLAGSLPFRDLVANYASVLSGAGVRGDDNNLFSSGDLLIDNVIVKEVPEFDRVYTGGGVLLENVGDSATVEVEPTFLLGAQAVLLAWAERTSVEMDEFDYKNKRGVAVAEIRGAEKATFNSFQHGVVTGYVSAQGD